MRLPAAAVLLCLFLPAAAAAQPWSAPTPIAGSPDAFSGLVFAPSGAGLAAWSTGGAAPENRYETFGAPIAAGGSAGPARKLGEGMMAGSFATYAPDRLVAVGGTFDVHPRPLWAVGTIGGTLSAPRRLAGARRGYASPVVANERGDFAVMLRLCPPRDKYCSRPTPHLVVRRAGGKLSKPIRLGARGPVYAATAAVNAKGAVLAVWERPLKGSLGRRGIYTRVRTAGGRLGRTKRIGTSHPIPKLSAALGDDGTTLVGWLGQRIGEGTPHTPAEIHVSLDGATEHVETVPLLGTGHYVGQTGVEVAIARDGRALAAWTGFQEDRFVVRAAEARPGAPVQVVSDATVDTVLADLATGGRGEAVVIGLSGIRGSDPAGPRVAVGVVAAVRPPAEASFTGVETVAAPKDFREAVDVELVPGTSRAVAVWRDLGTRSLVTATRDPIP